MAPPEPTAAQTLTHCAVCGSDEVAARRYDPPRAYCARHAGFEVWFDEERARLERALEDGRRDPATLYDLAVATLRAGDARAARGLLEELVEREPGRRPALERLADCEEALGQPERALFWQRRAVEQSPARGAGYARLGRILAATSDLDGALRAFEKGARRDRYDLECVRRAAVLRIARREAERAIDLLLRFLDEPSRTPEAIVRVRPRAPSRTARDYSSRLALEEAGEEVEGRRDYEVQAHRYLARILLGHAERSLGHREEALRAYEQAPRELSGLEAPLWPEVAAILETDADEVQRLVREAEAEA